MDLRAPGCKSPAMTNAALLEDRKTRARAWFDAKQN